MDVFCFSCQKVNQILGSQVGRRDECQFCKADLHVCKDCNHYDPKAYNECKEPAADVVKDKERSNFCDYFSAKATGAVVDEKAKLRAAAEALFKKN